MRIIKTKTPRYTKKHPKETHYSMVNTVKFSPRPLATANKNRAIIKNTIIWKDEKYYMRVWNLAPVSRIIFLASSQEMIDFRSRKLMIGILMLTGSF